MTHQNQCRHNEGDSAQKDEGKAAKYPNDDTATHPRRRNTQNRVSWHNSYTQKHVDEEGEGATDSLSATGSGDEKEHSADLSASSVALNFRSAALMSGFGANVQGALADSESTSSPSLFSTATSADGSSHISESTPLQILRVEDASSDKNRDLFSAPIISSDVFSFDRSKNDMSAELLPVISEVLPSSENIFHRRAIPITFNAKIASKSEDFGDFNFDDLPPEPLVEAPQSNILSELAESTALETTTVTADEERRRSMSVAHSASSVTVNDASSLKPVADVAADASIQHKRSASDHVLASTSYSEERSDENGLTTTKADQVRSDNPLLDAAGEERRLSVDKGKFVQAAANFVDAPAFENRLSLSTPSVHKSHLIDEKSKLSHTEDRTSNASGPVFSGINPLSMHFAATSFNPLIMSSSSSSSNRQYKTALVNSATSSEVRMRSEIDSGFESLYPGTSASTISNGTFFKSSSERKSLRKGKPQADQRREILQEMHNNRQSQPVISLAPKKSLAAMSTASISNLMDRFTSRRQHSDGNLRRLFPNSPISNLQQNPTTVRKDSPLPSMSSKKNMTSKSVDLIDEKHCGNNSVRRSFKWKSLFSTPKVGTATTSWGSQKIANKENAFERNVLQSKNAFKESVNGKTRLKKSISLTYALPSSTSSTNSSLNFSGRSNTLTPLMEDAGPCPTDPSSTDSMVKFRTSKTNTSLGKVNCADNRFSTFNATNAHASARPFSVIGSAEHDNLMVLQRYKINEADDKKFLDFLRMHETLPGNDTFLDGEISEELDSPTIALSNEIEDREILGDYLNVCSCGPSSFTKEVGECGLSGTKQACEPNIVRRRSSATSTEASFNDNKYSDLICSTNKTLADSGSCPKHGIRRRNSSEKQTSSQSILNSDCSTNPMLSSSNYCTLSRRRPRRMAIQNSSDTATRLRRRQSVCSISNELNTSKANRPFSPNTPSPCANNVVTSSATRRLRIQKRRMAANRRRSSINVNQVISAFHQQQSRSCKIEDQLKEQYSTNVDSEQVNEATKAPELNEVAGRDALKAIIMRQHSIKQAAKSRQDDKTNWRKQSAEKEKKRESKTNSVILGTLLSIRQKKKSKDARNLANIFPLSPAPSTAVSGGTTSLNRKESSPGFLDSRRSTLFPFPESKAEGLPDVLQSVLSGTGTIKDGHSTVSMVPSISPGFESSSQSFQFDDDISSFPRPLLVKQKWKNLELWSDEPGSWSSKHPDLNLSSAEKKRQNVIYEIYITEKHHCQVIVFLQQAYQAGLLNSGIMTSAEIKMLIPDVLDSLLDFHLTILRRIRERILASRTVNTISDIILEEFEEGEYRNAAINAYTNFCLAREDSYKVYSLYMERSVNFKKFFDHYERDPEYKGRSFKSCLLLIAQRLTKYPLLIEQICKHDSSANKPLSQRAHNAVKSFALKVDSELWLFELNRRWENFKKNMDKNSVGQLLGAPFTYDDLVHQTAEDPRKLLSISTVHWQSVTGQKIELSIVVFDDIVAFLHERNGVLQFFSQQDHASVIPLHTALIREMERTNEVMLIVLVKKKPDMYRLVFHNKTEMHNWISTVKKARLVAPKYVRTVRGAQHIDIGAPRVSGANGGEESCDPDEIAYNANIQRWQKQLQTMFAERMERESLLQEYFVERFRFFDALRRHLKDFPSRVPRSDSGLLPASARVRENRDIERMKSVLRARLNDLKENRRSTLNQLIETAQKARDSDLASFFDELYADGSIEEMRREFRHHHQHRNTTTESRDHKNSVVVTKEDEASGAALGPFSSSPESSASSAGASSEEFDETKSTSRCKPRRARTYHGTADSQKSSSSSSTTRRHTTVPKVGPGDEPASSMADEFTDQVNDQISRLPLRVGSKARRAATDLILENVAMRIENNKLRNEVALQDLHIASLRVKKAPMAETTEKLESLRQKHEEIQSQERNFRQHFERQMDELNRRREQLDRRETQLDEREMQMKAFAEAAAANFNAPSAANCLQATEEPNAMDIRNSNYDRNCIVPTSASQSHRSNHHHLSNQQQISSPNNTMTSLYGKLTHFRSGSAIHDLGGSVSSRNSSNGGSERQASCSTLPSAKVGGAAADVVQVPRHLAMKTETKPISDKRKKK